MIEKVRLLGSGGAPQIGMVTMAVLERTVLPGKCPERGEPLAR